VHLYLNTAAQGRLLDPAVADIQSVIMSVTKARDLLNDLAEEPTQNSLQQPHELRRAAAAALL
jgi:hypothetical protein